MSKEIRRPSPSHVPAEPFARRVEVFLARKQREFLGDLDKLSGAALSRHGTELHPVTLFLQNVYPDASRETARRRLFSLLHREQAWLSFDRADAILCHTEGPEAWWADPELAQIYWNVNLLSLDVSCPTSPGGFAVAREKVRKAYRRLSNQDKVCKALGVSQAQVSEITADLRVTA